MLEAVAQRLRIARLRLGLLLAELGKRVAGREGAARPPRPNPGLPLQPLIGPEAQAMLDAGRHPRNRRRREVEVRVPLVGSLEWRRAEAAKKAGG